MITTIAEKALRAFLNYPNGITLVAMARKILVLIFSIDQL